MAAGQEERASPGSMQHRPGMWQRNPSQEKDESKTFPWFFLTSVSGYNWALAFKGKIKTTAQQSLAEPSINSSELSVRCLHEKELPSLDPEPSVTLPLSLSHSTHAPRMLRKLCCVLLAWPGLGWEGASTPWVICFTEFTAELRN